MDNNKKPSEPVEEERWVKMEKEIKRLKRNNIIASGQPVAAKHRSFPKRPANQSP